MNMNITIVVGMGPNNVEIPLLIFPNAETAHKRLQELGLVPNEKNKNHYELEEESLTGKEIDNSLIQALFKNGKYYSGCGDCYLLVVREAKFGQPLICWNLD